MRRKAFRIAGVCIVAAALLAAGTIVANLQQEPSIAVLLRPHAPTDELLWPANHSFVWSINRLDPIGPGKRLALVVRLLHEELHGATPQIGPRLITKAECESELGLGGELPGLKPGDTASVAVQLIDMRETLVLPATEKRSLRLLLKLQAGGVTVERAGEQSVIDGDQFAGHWTNGGASWKDGELHLQCLFVRKGDRLTTYDVVLVVRSD